MTEMLHQSRSEDSYDDIVRQLESALVRLEEWGVPVPPTSRFIRYQERLVDLMGRPMGLATEAEIHQLQFDMREVDELLAIVSSFPGDLGDTARERMELVVTGAENPDAESASAARDAQWGAIPTCTSTESQDPNEPRES